MTDAAEHRAFNRDLWDKRVRAHLKYELYPSAQVEAGTWTVPQVEIDEVGDVAGKRLLHLQCNAGADTLYWARHGASVVGLDFSGEAIREATRLAEVTGLDARFVESDLYEARSQNLGRFDIVFTSVGVLWWLPDLTEWARIIADHLSDDGFFYIYEIHPFSMVFDWQATEPLATADYFERPVFVEQDSSGTYYEHGPDFESEAGTEVGWLQTLGEIVTALAGAGLQIEFLHEHDHAEFRQLGFFEKNDRGEWRPSTGPRLPWSFSLKARRGAPI